MPVEAKGAMQGESEEIVGEVNEHKHPPSQTTLRLLLRLKSHIKDRAETTQILADSDAASEGHPVHPSI